MTALPTLFVSHGSPMLALDAGPTGAAWRELARSLPHPRAIVAVSAHWSAPAPAVGNGQRHETIHDFYGFPAALYRLDYDAPGEPELAKRLAKALDEAGWVADSNPDRGLDHGVWVPLRSMYPAADIPIVPLAIDADRDPTYHYRLGQIVGAALAADVLLLASGSLTHNLGDFVPGQDGQPPPAYVSAFQNWIYEQLQAANLSALLNYRQRAPAAEQAHPSDEHLLPLFVALGAAGASSTATRHLDTVTERILAMDIYSFAR